MKLHHLLITTSVLFVGASADAGVSTSNMSVSATVTTSCTITANPLSFGSYDTVSGAAVDGSASVSVACTKGTVATVTLGQGLQPDTGSSDALPLRRMKDAGTNHLAYTLFQDAGRTAVWGNTAGTAVGYTATGSGAVSLTVFGRISGNQDVPAGGYSDTVVATITF